VLPPSAAGVRLRCWLDPGQIPSRRSIAGSDTVFKEIGEMNLVGKLLVVLILVMSVAFMAFSVAVYSTHKNWMDVITNPNTGYQVKLREQQAINQKLTEQLTKRRPLRTRSASFRRKGILSTEMSRR
jgi:hypothetical protein